MLDSRARKRLSQLYPALHEDVQGTTFFKNIKHEFFTEDGSELSSYADLFTSSWRLPLARISAHSFAVETIHGLKLRVILFIQRNEVVASTFYFKSPCCSNLTLENGWATGGSDYCGWSTCQGCGQLYEVRAFFTQIHKEIVANVVRERRKSFQVDNDLKIIEDWHAYYNVDPFTAILDARTLEESVGELTSHIP